MKIFTSFLYVFLFIFIVSGQNYYKDSVQLKAIYNQVLNHGNVYENLRSLCKDVGHRLSGSQGAEKAVQWGKIVLQRYNLDTVWLQKVMVPHWIRGDVERLDFISSSTEIYQSNCSALGGSIGTNNGVLSGQVVEIKSWDQMKELGKKNISGKLVFLNRPMNPSFITTFQAYGSCVDQRHQGASEAAKYGAVGVIVRSMTLKYDRNPHTGSMSYTDSIPKIPAVAISTVDAHHLSEMLKKDPDLTAKMKLSCKTFPDAVSYNVIGEIRGTEFPEKVMVVGGHLDSWDVGEGAHDDGAGVVQSIEVMSLFNQLKIRPKHTVRCILYMNEENGNRGGKTYASFVKNKGEQHIMAIESDRGGFSPRGFSVDGTATQLAVIQAFEELFEPYQLHLFKKGYGGVDIGPLRDGKICLIGLVPDSQRYFDYHHAPTDVFENVNKRELELGAAALTSIIYLIDKYGFESTGFNE